HFQIWNGSAKKEIPCAPGFGEGDWGVVPDRAGSRLRRGWNTNDRSAQWQMLGTERCKDLHNERPLRELLRGHGRNRQVQRIAWDQCVYSGKRNVRIQAGQEGK